MSFLFIVFLIILVIILVIAPYLSNIKIGYGESSNITLEELLSTPANFIYITGKPATGKSTISKLLAQKGYHVIHSDEIIKEHFKGWPNWDSADDIKTASNLFIDLFNQSPNKKIVLEGLLPTEVLIELFKIHPADLIVYIQHVSAESHMIAILPRAIEDVRNNMQGNLLGGVWNMPGKDEAIKDFNLRGPTSKLFLDYLMRAAEKHMSNVNERREEGLKPWNYRILYVDYTKK